MEKIGQIEVICGPMFAGKSEEIIRRVRRLEYAKKKGADILLRGLRTSFDFEYELQLSQTNNALYNDLKTVFLITKPEYNFISSSMVREILANKGDISKFVPNPVSEYLKAKYDI